ncbi:MAG: MCP four helix bundle domain-containing protein, partial [Rhodocyclales bacterium]|nr:MCP four helix bundle domain-containing protein [Rhodocyclales bacterium]
MTITQRFNSLLIGVFLCLSCLAGLFVFEMGRVYDAVNFANTNIVPSVMLLDDATRNFGKLRLRIYRHLLNSDPAHRREIEGTIVAAQTELKRSLDKYAPLIVDEEDRLMLAADNAALAEYSSHIAAILTASGNNRDQEALRLINLSVPIAERLNDALDAHIDYNERLGKHSADHGVDVKNNAIWMLTLVGGVLVIAVFGFGYVITRSLSRAMVQSSTVAGRIAKGDLSSAITVQGDDETVEMLGSLQTMQDSLSQIVGEIREIVEAAALRGDFSIKLSLDGKEGYIRDLSVLLNQLSAVTEGGLCDSVRVANALAEGDLTQTIDSDYPGQFGAMAAALASLQRVSVELEDQRWAKEQLANILGKVQQAEAMEEFGTSVLALLCPAVAAVQGLIYADID